MDFLIRTASGEDLPEIEAILPRLASFEVPEKREPEQLWHGDRDMFRAWANGERPDVFVSVAQMDNQVVGIAAISTRKELLSGEPSAHLEVLALLEKAEGSGIGTALLKEAESMATARGAKSMSLHVFAANKRARALYERHGFDGEVLRYFKSID